MNSPFNLQERFSVDIGATEPEILLPDELSFQWLFYGQVFCFVARNSSRRLADAWAKRILDLASTWDTAQLMISYHDFSDPRCVMTPYVRAKNEEMVRLYPNINTFSVAVMNPNLLTWLLSQATRVNVGEHRISRLFTNHDQALHALQAKLEKLKSKNEPKT
ncbi:MAG: hypothetical protein OHK0023_19490 [Anaerolineae bacterium]